ncbi:helix-turn-helix transcriptional regulator [Hyphococcus flavus]|uniref:Helix-turn-helix transcriptional regulator n=1 Tax=Hyphococcus flavus TaxID=1866326 RepID=A0AAE9ZFU8_9PROT|nr:helix-turn-helix transcriptional regulator [Hyphococcus flavus]WDI30051.1 helix-turn-helix transcriptional regulator [Hyphococcus flavus]
MHPLKQYLSEVEEPVRDFAERIGASRQTLYRIINGAQAPKPALARRIVEATGGAVTLNMLYGGGAPGSADIVNLDARGDERPLDHGCLRLAIAVVVNHLRSPDAQLSPPDTMDVAAEAVANTYVALSKVTTRQGPARLEQALRPVLEEILKECGGSPAAAALDRGAELAAQLYLKSGEMQRSL